MRRMCEALLASISMLKQGVLKLQATYAMQNTNTLDDLMIMENPHSQVK